MKWAVGILGALNSTIIISIGFMWAIDDDVFGLSRPGIGIPIIVVGVALIPFIIFCIRQLLVIQSLVMLGGIVLVAAGVFWLMDVLFLPAQGVADFWPGILWMLLGMVFILFSLYIPEESQRH